MVNHAQQDLIDRFTVVLNADDRIRAAALSGSLGKGEGDDFSDVDLTLAVEEEDLAACVAEYGGARNPLGPTVVLGTLYGRVVTAVTPAWERYDLLFVTLPEFRGLSADAVKVLFRKPGATGPSGGGPRTAPVAHSPVRAQVVEFMRMLGLAPVAIGREEWLVGQEGSAIMRKALVDLMVEANGLTGQRGGMKRLNAFLTPRQRADLEALPEPKASREGLLATHAALAALFLPLARELCESRGVDWPEDVEQALRRHLQASLGVTL